MHRALIVALAALALAGCGDDGAPPDAAPDAPVFDAAIDASMDAGTDAPPAPDGATPDVAPPDAGPEPCAETDPRAVAPETFVGPDGLPARLTGLIDSATGTLTVTMYQLAADEMVTALSSAAARGVHVRVIVDGDQRVNEGPVSRLRAAGVDVREASTAFSHYHGKTMVIDGAVGVIMSANMNDYSLWGERNHGVVLRDPFDVADLAALFEHDWNGSTGSIDLACTRLVVGPENSRARILALLARATRELRIQHLSLSDDEVRAAIANRVAAGVRVQILLADPAWIDSNTEAAMAMRAAGADVRFLTFLDNHAKLIVSDDEEVYVGSTNLSWTSLMRNREVGVVLTDGGSLSALSGQFDSDWSRSR